MKIYASLVLVLGVFSQVRSSKITLDEPAQIKCRKYRCPPGKICAVQQFDWPKNISIQVCIPLSFVPEQYQDVVRNLICQLPPDRGRCFARYIRWHWNMHQQECTHFRYGGCSGNRNNFKTKDECEKSCMATPSISLYEGGQSALVQPPIVSQPVYETPKENKYDSLNSVMVSDNRYNNYDRYHPMKNRNNRVSSAEGNTRKRRHRSEKELRARERRRRRKEKKRLKRLRRKQKKSKSKKKNGRRKGRKNRKKKTKTDTAVVNETPANSTDVAGKATDVVKKTTSLINNEIESMEQTKKKGTRKDRKRRKRRQRRKRRLEQEMKERRNVRSYKDSYGAHAVHKSSKYSFENIRNSKS